MIVRDAYSSELDALALLFFEGWQDAHMSIVPPALVRVRTIESFHERLAARLPIFASPSARGTRPQDSNVIEDDELYNLHVARQARGTGVATALIADAEARLAGAGVGVAWLACTVGNDRAAQFYEKSGWHRACTEPYLAETSEGAFLLDVWRYEKRLAPLAAAARTDVKKALNNSEAIRGQCRQAELGLPVRTRARTDHLSSVTAIAALAARI